MAGCSLCRGKLGIFRHTIADGAICSECYKKCGFTSDIIDSTITLSRCKEILANKASRTRERDKFTPTRIIPGFIEVNENNETWVVLGGTRQTGMLSIHNNNRVAGPFTYDNIADVELYEDGTVKDKVSMKKVVFMTRGGSIKDKGKCEKMYIRIKLRDTYTAHIDIMFVQYPVQKTSDTYAISKSNAEKCYNLLESMKQIADDRRAKEEKDAVNNIQAVANSISLADELIKFKELLDMGIITQEEFNAKKEEFMKASFNKN